MSEFPSAQERQGTRAHIEQNSCSLENVIAELIGESGKIPSYSEKEKDTRRKQATKAFVETYFFGVSRAATRCLSVELNQEKQPEKKKCDNKENEDCTVQTLVVL